MAVLASLIWIPLFQLAEIDGVVKKNFMAIIPLMFSVNNLVKQNTGVWCLDKYSDFAYSDGEEAELNLQEIIRDTSDLSSCSRELEENIHDWVSEYHLSSQRSNLLRAFNLNKVENALELGCGCGSLTRYLGAQGITLDAVEGSRRRAEITRLRCGDLDNVNIINANFNDLTFPEDSYNAVFLIGILEYAQKFCETQDNSRKAVLHILNRAKTSLKKGGVVVIAIENRMGLKYWLGASEDHYGEPYVGLYDYPDNRGIQTYNQGEWRQLLDVSENKAYRFIYPFPDYKLPKVILSANYIQTDENAFSLLSRMSSRDYSGKWRSPCNEFLLWKSLHKAGSLEEFANSFLIIASDSQESLDLVMPYDFVYFSDAAREPEYRTVTRKEKGQGYVIKESLFTKDKMASNQLISQKPIKEHYIHGPLLSTLWLEAILDKKGSNTFDKLLERYYLFLLDFFHTTDTPGEAFDVLPMNIIADYSGIYRIIDRGWVVTQNVNSEYILFRALMSFCHDNQDILSNFFKEKGLETIKDFISYGFSILSLELEQEKLEGFIGLQEKIQEEIGSASVNYSQFIFDLPFQIPLCLKNVGLESELNIVKHSKIRRIFNLVDSLLNMMTRIVLAKLKKQPLTSLRDK